VPFPERSPLISLINELVRAEGGERVKRDTVRPTLVLEGIGGSGRSTVLRHTWETWARTAPIAFVDPVAVGNDDPGSMRSVLVAVMLGLTADVPEYKISFPRVVLAQIAMAGPIADAGDPVRSVQAMQERINSYHDRGRLTALIGGLARAAARLLQIPGVDTVAGKIAEQIVERLRRTGLPARLAWGDALNWFGHQDQGFHFKPYEALVRLSLQAQNADAGVPQDVDRLLMAALLADLRDSFARAVNHPANAVVLLDNGDAPSAQEFMNALATIRRRLDRHRRPRDPLTVIMASGGLPPAKGTADRPPAWSESDLEKLTAGDVAGAGTSLRVILRGFTVEDIGAMEAANSSHHLGSSVIASTIHRFTGGHAESTVLLLNHLVERPQDEHPRLINDLGAMVAEIEPRPGVKLEQYLIDKITSAVSRRRRVDQRLREDLITLAAARDKAEAELLTPLIGNPKNRESVLFTLPTLWSADGPRGHRALAPFVRHTLLRALAARSADHRASWNEVFATLRSYAENADDVGGRLHHELALGNVDIAVDELNRLRTRISGEEWLALLDQTVATPDPRSSGPAVADEVDPGDHRGYIARLVTCLRALADPRLSDRARLRDLYLLVGNDYFELGRTVFLERGQHYLRLAEELA
jgi:hypothetical protein